MHGLTNDTNRKILLYLGGAMIAVGMGMTFMFGLSMSLLHAISLAGLTLAAGVMWGPIDDLELNGWRKMARFLRIVGCFFIAAELFSHLGYTVGNRVENVETAGVKNAAYERAGKAVATNETTLTFLRERLAKMEAEQPWLPTVNAAALRSKLASANLAIEQEAKRGGCGPKCLKLTQERDDLDSRIKLAESKDDLTRQIAATTKLVNERVDKADATEFVSSKVVNQTKFVSQLATFSLDPSAAALTWAQIGIAFVVALVTTFLGPTCWRLATAGQFVPSTPFPTGRPEAFTEPAPTQTVEPAYASPSITMPVARAAHAPQHRNMVVKATTNTIADLRRTLQGIGNQPAYGTM